MFVTLLVLIFLAMLVLSLLKITGVVGWSWLVILKIVGYPTAFLSSLAGLILLAALFVRLVRWLLEFREKNRS